MNLTDREKKIIAFALNYMGSNLDDINEMLSEEAEFEADSEDASEEYKSEFNEQEVFDLYGKFKS